MWMRRCSDDSIEHVKDLVEKIMGKSFDHGYPHIERVWRIAYEIVEAEKLDIDPCILDASILLHDIGRVISEPHAYYSALIARSILSEQGFQREFIEKVVNAILYHSYSYARNHHVKPLSEEAKVLSDADKLDALGITGFIRVFLFDKNRSLNEIMQHFNEKILKLPEYMHYRYSRERAEELKKRVILSLNWLFEELGKQ